MPVPTDEATATPTDETTATATPVPTDEATGTPAPVPTDEATGTPAPIPTDEATGTPAPTDAAEVKTIASFEAVAPEGFAVPQGTLETDLGLPVSLNAQFSDGAAGEVPVAWQCAAGYDPSAEAGTQFIFAAVLPEGYALAEGVSLPQILVTLTPPLANAMPGGAGERRGLDAFRRRQADGDGQGGKQQNPILCERREHRSGRVCEFHFEYKCAFSRQHHGHAIWSLYQSGKCFRQHQRRVRRGLCQLRHHLRRAITGQVSNLNTGSITVGDFTEATVENFDGSVIGGTFSNVAFDSTSGELTITGNVDLDEEDALAPLTIRQAQIKSVVVAENGTFNAGSASFLGPVTNNGTITGGTFEGEVLTSPSCVISGGDFKNATAINGGGIINGGIFSNFTMDSETGKLTIPARST